jgi:hypothetical protein
MEQSITTIDNEISILESKINTLKNQKAEMQKLLKFPNEQLFIQEFKDAIKKNEYSYNFESNYTYDVYYFGKKVYNHNSSDCLNSKILDEFEKKYNIKFRIEGSTWREGSMGPYPGSHRDFRVR